MNDNGSSINNQDEIVLTQNVDIFNPVEIDFILTVAHFLCCSIGIPLNVSIVVTIVRLRRLYRKPRNIFLLGIIFSNLSFFVPAIIKLIYWGLYPIEFVCQIYVALVGVPQGLLSLNMLLALIDRYLAISHPLYHREKMTVRLACGLVPLSSSLVVFLLKFVYILGVGTLRCEVWLFHTKIVLIILTVVFASCIALNVIVYRRTRNHLSESQCFASLTNDADNSHQIQTVETINLGNVTERNESRATAVVQNDGTYPIIRPMSIHVSRQKLCQMEMEAAHTLVVGVTSVIITSLPPTIFVSIFLVCRFVSQSECSHLNWLAPYMIELGLIKIVTSPLIFIVRSKELRTALTCRLNQV
jgi:hypothetical protein